MARWFKYFDSALDDPRIQKLDDRTFKVWVNLLCLASRSNGVLPPDEQAAFALRLSDEEYDTLVLALIRAELLTAKDGKLSPRDWETRQFTDRTNAARQKRYREARNGVTKSLRNGVTPLDIDIEEEGRLSVPEDSKESPPREESSKSPPIRMVKG